MNLQLEPLEISVKHDSDSLMKTKQERAREEEKIGDRKHKFEVDGRLMKFKGEPPEEHPEMTIMIGPASSIASTESKYITPVKQMVDDLGIQTKSNKEYILVQVRRKREHFTHLSLGIKNIKRNKVLVSRIDDVSYVSNILQIGDRILAINGKKVEDKIQCKKLILDNNGDFEALIERNKPISEGKFRNVDSFVFTQFIPTSTSNSQCYLENSDNDLGNPLYGYEKPPDDVRQMAHKFLEEMNRDTNTRENSNFPKVKERDIRVSIDDDITVDVIPSEIDPNRILKTPHRNACFHV